MRPLGIPTIRARAQQALLVLALEPWFEAIAEPGVYGYRKGRGCADALYRIRSGILRSPRWVLDADIEKFFDRVDHDALLAKVDAPGFMKSAIRRMLKARILCDGELLDPETGTPQGGVLSPLLANLVLHGLETMLAQAPHQGKPWLCVRYADDFVVLTDTREDAVKAQALVSAWLAPMGLNLKNSKTRIAHTLHRVDCAPAGFDFLGVRVWQKQLGKYGGKESLGNVVTLLHPSAKSVAAHVASLGELFRSVQCPEGLISAANRKIRGWVGYFRAFNAKSAFSTLDHHLWWTSWKWGRRNFKGLGKRERKARLYPKGWRFEPATGYRLCLHAETPIHRHTLVRSDARYFSREWHYWATRTGRYPLVPDGLAALLKRQNGRCMACGDRLTGRVMVTRAAKDGRLSACHAPTCSEAVSSGRS
jgi:Retron-type reverse transcriptase